MKSGMTTNLAVLTLLMISASPCLCDDVSSDPATNRIEIGAGKYLGWGEDWQEIYENMTVNCWWWCWYSCCDLDFYKSNDGEWRRVSTYPCRSYKEIIDVHSDVYRQLYPNVREVALYIPSFIGMNPDVKISFNLNSAVGLYSDADFAA